MDELSLSFNNLNNDKLNKSGGNMTGYLGIKGDSNAINFISSTTTNKQKWLYPGTFSTTNAITNYMPNQSGTLATQEWCHTVTSINDKVTWVNSSYINTTYTYFTCAMNKIVYFQIYFAATIASGGQVGTIASGYRFTGQQCWFPIVSAHGNNVYPARLTLATDGKITVVGTVTSGMFCSGMYIIY